MKNMNFSSNYAFKEGGAILIKKLSPSYKADTVINIDSSYYLQNSADK